MSVVSGEEPFEVFCRTDGAMLRRDGNWTINGAGGLTSIILQNDVATGDDTQQTGC